MVGSSAFNRLTIALEHLRIAAAERRRLLELTLRAQESMRVELLDQVHAGPLQSMAAASLQADMLTGPDADPLAAQRLARAVRDATDELRGLLSDFASDDQALDTSGFVGALQERVRDRFEARMGDLDVTYDLVDIPPPLLHHLFRIALEAACNAVEHTPPGTEVFVALRTSGSNVVLTVDDAGPPIDVDAITGRAQEGHLGVALMRERAEWIGGTFELSPSSVGGLRVTVTAPSTAHVRG
jgi:signal transduction histidine kinase